MTSACDKIMHHMKSRGLTLIKEWLVININNMAADRTSLSMDEVTGTATCLCIKIHLAFFTELKH